jgi:flagellar biosynthesis/type III secretory pathway M-ring protein FliF/YscJ
MLTWVSAKVTAYRKRGWVWRAIAVGLVVLTVLIAWAVLMWRRRAQAAREHELFVAQVDAREAAELARTNADDAQVDVLKERAAAAARREDLAAAEAASAQLRHAEDLISIDRIRSWSDVPDGPRRPGL